MIRDWRRPSVLAMALLLLVAGAIVGFTGAGVIDEEDADASLGAGIWPDDAAILDTDENETPGGNGPSVTIQTGNDSATGNTTGSATSSGNATGNATTGGNTTGNATSSGNTTSTVNGTTTGNTTTTDDSTTSGNSTGTNSTGNTTSGNTTGTSTTSNTTGTSTTSNTTGTANTTTTSGGGNASGNQSRLSSPVPRPSASLSRPPLGGSSAIGTLGEPMTAPRATARRPAGQLSRPDGLDGQL